MSSLLSGVRVCSLCGQTGRCFDLGSTLGTQLSETERAGKAGCLECLRLDRFGFSHDTEVGFFTKEGFLPLYEPDTSPKQIFLVSGSGEATMASVPLIYPPKPHLAEEAIAELRRTPEFATWQDIMWPVHHDDFMAYFGIWSPDDLAAIYSPGTARELFLEMVDSDFHNLWPEGKEPKIGQNIVAFQCLHCSTRRGILDFD